MPHSQSLFNFFEFCFFRVSFGGFWVNFSHVLAYFILFSLSLLLL
jgi:hypothetical protein